MKDSGLLIFIVLLIASFSAWFIWLLLKPITSERALSMLVAGATVLFLSYGLCVQSSLAAVFSR